MNEGAVPKTGAECEFTHIPPGHFSAVNELLQSGKDTASELRAARYIRDIEGGGILKLPVTLTAEAAAIGAKIACGDSGIHYAEYSFGEISCLHSIPLMHEQEPVQFVLDCIKNAGEPVMLQVQGPYSVLSSAIEPALFLRWMVKNPGEIEKALNSITLGLFHYIRAAFGLGVRIVSVTDLNAMPEIIGEERYKRFSAKYLAELLQRLRESESRGIVHLCPRSSVLLEKYSYVASEEEKAADEDYVKSLLQISKEKGFAIAGHQCINKARAGQVVLLNLI